MLAGGWVLMVGSPTNLNLGYQMCRHLKLELTNVLKYILYIYIYHRLRYKRSGHGWLRFFGPWPPIYVVKFELEAKTKKWWKRLSANHHRPGYMWLELSCCTINISLDIRSRFKRLLRRYFAHNKLLAYKTPSDEVVGCLGYIVSVCLYIV